MDRWGDSPSVHFLVCTWRPARSGFQNHALFALWQNATWANACRRPKSACFLGDREASERRTALLAIWNKGGSVPILRTKEDTPHWFAMHQKSGPMGRLPFGPLAHGTLPSITPACQMELGLSASWAPAFSMRYACAARYSSSETGSSHSLLASTPGTSTARCANHESAAAPCQCLTPAGMLTTVPGTISTASLPHSW